MFPTPTSGIALFPLLVTAPVLTISLVGALMGEVGAQEKDIRRLLRRLDTRTTDWALWQSVCDRVRASKKDRVKIILDEIESASVKYHVRLARVLAEIDSAEGLRRLGRLCQHEDGAVAGFAARTLGRTRAPAAEIARRLTSVFQTEKRATPRMCLLIAMGECGHAPLFEFLEKLVKSGELHGHQGYWAQYAMALLAQSKHEARARTWIGGDAALSLAGILIAKKLRDENAVAALLDIARNKEQPQRAQAVHALAAIGGSEVRKSLISLAEDLVAEERGRQAREGVRLTSHDDPLYLAMLRLDHPIGHEWAERKIAQSDTLLVPNIARIPELIATWRLPKAQKILESCFGSGGVPPGVRVRAGRGLCRIGDARGVEILASVIRKVEDTGLNEMAHAQTFLHELVANPDRPEFADVSGENARKIGAAWEKWLKVNRGRIQWRQPWDPEQSMVEGFLLR